MKFPDQLMGRWPLKTTRSKHSKDELILFSNFDINSFIGASPLGVDTASRYIRFCFVHTVDIYHGNGACAKHFFRTARDTERLFGCNFPVRRFMGKACGCGKHFVCRAAASETDRKIAPPREARLVFARKATRACTCVPEGCFAGEDGVILRFVSEQNAYCLFLAKRQYSHIF